MRSNKRTAADKPRIRTQLIWTLTIFLTIGLILLLLFQTVFLDDLYEFGTIRTAKTAAKAVAEVLPDNGHAEEAEYWSVREGCDVLVVDAKGQIAFSHGFSREALRLTQGDLQAYYDLAKKQNGEVLQTLELEFEYYEDPLSPKPPKGEKPGGDKKPPSISESKNRLFNTDKTQSVLYAVMAQNAADETQMVMVLTMMTPVDAAVRVLQVQMLIAMVLFVCLAVVLAWVMGKHIATPIAHINRAAKELASGAYQPPEEGSYREVAELRETLTLINGELRKSEQFQRDLIANVSHDLRTPLTMIIGYSEAIRDLPGEDSAENIQVVIDEAARLSHLVNDVLDLSKLQSGVEQFEWTPIRPADCLRDVVSRVGTMMQQEGYSVDLHIEDEVTVSADEVRLSRIVYNLLLNALAHTGEDRRVIVIQKRIGDRVRVSFTDTGKGIPEEELSNIWLRYYQVHSHERRQSMNSGLGLSIVHALVERHGGECGVESEIGTGSTFWFELPLL